MPAVSDFDPDDHQLDHRGLAMDFLQVAHVPHVDPAHGTVKALSAIAHAILHLADTLARPEITPVPEPLVSSPPRCTCAVIKVNEGTPAEQPIGLISDGSCLNHPEPGNRVCRCPVGPSLNYPRLCPVHGGNK